MSEKTITRAQLTDIIYREIGLSHSESAALVDSVFEEIIKALESGESVKLSSFGTFDIREKKERIGRNPKTKEEVPISARKVVTFHASNILTKRINSEEGQISTPKEESVENSGEYHSTAPTVESNPTTPDLGEIEEQGGSTEENW